MAKSPALRSFKSWILFLVATVAVTAGTDAYAQIQIGQQLADPAYYWPGTAQLPTTDWTPLNATGPLASPTPGRTGIAVANVLNGPNYTAFPISGDPSSPNWSNVIGAAHTNGIKVLGYVDSGYFGTLSNQTRLRQTGVEAWRSQIEHDINDWYNFYGSNIDGIFLDQGQNACGVTGNPTAYSDLYKTISNYVKQNHPGAIVALNPGLAAPYCYKDSADILVTFEGKYNCYAGITYPGTADGCGSVPGEVVYTSPQSLPTGAWPAYADPNKFWHLIYATDGTLIGTTFSLSKQRNAGYVYVTPFDLPNPWGNLPWASYWSLEQSGAAPVNTGTTPPSAPTNLHTAVVGYTTATLEWNKSTGSNGVVAYDIYQNGAKIWSVPEPTTTTAWADLDGLLQPNTSYSFTVKARDKAGLISSASSTLIFSTLATGVAPPSAPGSLTSSALTYTSVKLSWTASTGAATVVGYDVYQDGTKVMTVWESATDGPPTSATIIGLAAGHTGYAFTVKARNWQGGVSAASNSLSVSTPLLPGGNAIANPARTYTSPNITYSVDYLVPMGFHRVYIKSGNAGSCYWVGVSPNQICVDYSIENGGNLKKYAGDGSTYVWNDLSPVVTPVLTAPTTSNTYSWGQIPASVFAPKLPTDQTVIFQGDGFWPSTYSSTIPPQP
jgi:hypothetical protein